MTETTNIEMDLDIQDYARKPFYIKAVYVTPDNIEKVARWCGGELKTPAAGIADRPYIHVRVPRAMNERQTQAFVGDWVLQSPQGFKVYTQKAFSASFQPASKPEKEEAVKPDDLAHLGERAVPHLTQYPMRNNSGSYSD